MVLGRHTPALYPYSGDTHCAILWEPSQPPDPYIPGDEEANNCAQGDSMSTMATSVTVASMAGLSISNAEEHERSKDRLKDLTIGPTNFRQAALQMGLESEMVCCWRLLVP
jgi:hypothetical protein